MEEAGIPNPVYKQTDFMLNAELRNKNYGVEGASWDDSRAQAGTQAGVQADDQNTDQSTEAEQISDIKLNQDKLVAFCGVPRSRADMMKFLGMTSRKHFAENYMEPLLDDGRIKMTIPEKPSSPKQKYVKG